MKAWGQRLSVRVRLTLWYAGAMIVVLGLYAGGVYAFIRHSYSETLDANLRSDFSWPAEMMTALPEGVKPSDEVEAMKSGPWLRVWSPDGKELHYESYRAKSTSVPASDGLTSTADGRPVWLPADQTPPMQMRVLTGRGRIGEKDFVIQVGRSELEISDELNRLALIFLLGLPLSVLVACLGGYSLARRALAPVENMAERARLITAERLGDRLPVDNPKDELGRLASVFNETLTRLESSFDAMRRFTADASHELRTPLTAMRSVGEVGLRGRRDANAYREIIGSMLEEVDRLSRLVDRLLTLSRADSGEVLLVSDSVDLGALAAGVAEQMGVLAEEKQQAIVIERPSEALWLGDPLVLRQAMFNLVDNAIKYTPEGGRIVIRVDQGGSAWHIEVSDTGPGIPEELRPKIFDRFYRVDRARSRENGGMGLGLSIARWAVEVSGGRLTIENVTRGTGTTFRITLPMSAPAAIAAVPRTVA